MAYGKSRIPHAVCEPNSCPEARRCVQIHIPSRHYNEKTPSFEGAFMAERMGFEPMLPVRVNTISSRAP